MMIINLHVIMITKALVIVIIITARIVILVVMVRAKYLHL